MKKPIKLSEARILIYLHNVDSPMKWATKMSVKLGMDYIYLLRILAQMKQKNWIKPIRRANKIFYEPTNKAPLVEANERVLQQKKAN